MWKDANSKPRKSFPRSRKQAYSSISCISASVCVRAYVRVCTVCSSETLQSCHLQYKIGREAPHILFSLRLKRNKEIIWDARVKLLNVLMALLKLSILHLTRLSQQYVTPKHLKKSKTREMNGAFATSSDQYVTVQDFSF